MEQEIGLEKPPWVPSDPTYSIILCSMAKDSSILKMLWVLMVFSVMPIVNSIGSYLNHRTSMHYHSVCRDIFFCSVPDSLILSQHGFWSHCSKKVVLILFGNIQSLDFSSSPLKKYTLLSKRIKIHKYNSKSCHAYFEHSSNQDLIHTINLC